MAESAQQTACYIQPPKDCILVPVLKYLTLSKTWSVCSHVEMLRDDMGILKKEVVEARGQMVQATNVTDNIDGRFHLLESEMSGVQKKLQDDFIGPKSPKAHAKAQVSFTSQPACG